MIRAPRILVVDDDEGTRRTLALILERKGYAVETAGTAEEALERADDGPFNAGLLDIKLPDAKGVELLSPLKSRQPDMEMIMVTGYASTETAMRALNDGATAYITKPLDMDEVLAEVRKIVEKQRLVTEKQQAEEKIRHINAVLDAIRTVNRLIVREPDRNRLIQRACESLIETRGYVSAWIALQDGSGKVSQFVSAGLEEQASEMAEALERGEWPTCARRALNEAGVVIVEESDTMCGGCPLVDAHGSYHGLVAPLIHGGRAYGVLNITVPVDFAPEQDVSLFAEVADDIALALHGMELEEQSERATRALRISEERYRGLFEDSPTALWEEDFSGVKTRLDELKQEGVEDLRSYFREHREAVKECVSEIEILDVNRAAMQLHGAESKEELLSGLHTVFTEESYAAFAEELALIAAEKRQFDLEFAAQTLDGERREVIARWSAMPGHEETLSKVLVSATDITERKRVEAERERYIRELQLITDTTVVGSRMEDIEGMCTVLAEAVREVNPGSYVTVSFYDRDAEAIRIRAIAGLGDEANEIFELLGGDPRGIAVEPAETIQPDPNGSKLGKLTRVPGGLHEAMAGTVPREKCRAAERAFGIGAAYRVGFAVAGEPRGSVTIFVPARQKIRHPSAIETLASHFSVLMRQVQAEEALREREERYRNLFQQSNDGIFLHDLEGNIIDVNQRVLELTGYSRGEMMSLRVRDLHPAEKLEASRQAFKTLMKEGLVSFEIDFRRKNGETFPAEVSSSLFEISGRKVIQGIARDITERKRAEEELARQSEEVARINAELERHTLQLEWLTTIQSALSQADGAGDILTALALAIDVDQPPRSIRLEYITETDERGRPTKLRPAAIWEDGLVVPDHSDLERARGLEDSPLSDLWLETPHEPLFITDVQEDARVTGQKLALVEQIGFRSALVMPLHSGGRWQGVVTVLWSEPHASSREESFYIGQLVEPLAAIVASHRAHVAQQESEARYRALFNNASDATFIYDLQGRFLAVNDVACKRLGYEREELLDMTVGDIDAPEDVPPVSQRIEDLLQRGRLVFETFEVRADGHKIPVEVSTRLIDYRGQKAVLSDARDISERLEMEEQLQRQERLAAVGQLAGGIAHDFRNFLTTIILYAGMPLRKPDLDPQVENALEVVASEAKQASDLVQQILDFSGRSAMETRPVDLVEFIRESADILRQTIPESIQFEVSMEPTSAVVEADPTRIQQVLMNLALNARDAMPEGGDLEIGLSKVTVSPDEPAPVPSMAPGGWIYLTVSDTGTGMSEEVKERIFEPFFTTKEPGKGTGLGLAQVYGIVKQHQGVIDVETEVGEGTVFHVYLPVHGERAAEEEEGGEGSEPVPEGHGEMILLVEDQEKLREAAREMLSSLNYRVLTAATGEEALETLQGIMVDLVITDIVMPRMGGKALIKELGRTFPDLRALAVTGYTMEQAVEDLREAGFAGVLHKPFDTPALAQAVREVLDRG